MVRRETERNEKKAYKEEKRKIFSISLPSFTLLLSSNNTKRKKEKRF